MSKYGLCDTCGQKTCRKQQLKNKAGAKVIVCPQYKYSKLAGKEKS